MTKPWFFLPRLNVLIGSNRFVCNSCNSLKVEITYSDLKEILICFPCWHVSLRIWVFQQILSSPFTKYFLDNFEICFRLTCPSFLCQNNLSSSLDNRHATIMLTKIYQINLIQVVVSSGSKEELVILWLNYTLVFFEGHKITIVAKLTYV